MKQKINIFGSLVELFGSNLIEIDAIQSSHELENYLHAKYPFLQQKKYILAVNHQIVQSSILLDPNAEIAIMPPFSGG